MAVKDHDRALVYNWLDEHAGTEVATAMMEMFPPVNWTDVATRHDIAALDARIGRVEVGVASITTTMATKADVEQALAPMATKQDLAELHVRIQRTFVTWMLASQTATIAAVGVILAVLRI